MTRRRRVHIGILGGTFNPIHLGHLLIAQDALEQAHLDRVVFIPAARPPHKLLPGNASAAHRLRMVRLAIAGDARFSVDDLELRRGGKSYSVETLTELRAQHPAAEYHFIIGADSLPELPFWRDAGKLVRLCRFIVLARPGFAVRRPRRLTGLRCEVCSVHPCEIASREIRARIAAQRSIRYLVPEPVRRYIERYQLYR